jgi:DNA-binding MarR family transcriptional regulator
MQPLLTEPKTRASRCAVKILDAVPPTTWFIRRQMRGNRKGLSMLQFRALYYINANPSTSLSAVAEHVGASLPSASRLVAGLEAQDLVERSGSEDDRRQMKLMITREGAQVMDAARAATLERIDEELASLDKEQRVLLGSAMDLLRGLFDPAFLAANKERAVS